MPIMLKTRDLTADLEKFKSVLIVSCPMCPPMNLAIQTRTPFIEFHKHGIKTHAYEGYVKSLQQSLRKRGVRTDTFTTRLPSPLMCVWTEGQRKRLLKRVKGHEAVVVMGCTSAVHTAEEVLKDTGCQVIPGMRMRGINNATMKYQFPLTVKLETTPAQKEGFEE